MSAMSKAKTPAKLTKGGSKVAKGKAAEQAKGKAKKAASRSAKVFRTRGSGKSSAHSHLRKAIEMAIDHKLAEAIDEIAAEDASFDLIITRKGEPTTVVEHKTPHAGPDEDRRGLWVSGPQTIALELVPDREEKSCYRMIWHHLEPSRPTTSELADRMLPEARVPSPAQVLLARGESELRWTLLEEFGALTSEEIADRRSRAKNRHAIANRWRSEDKVFSVEVRGRRIFPGFQFDGESLAPEPLVAQVLAALPREEMSEWEIALWWVAADPWLDGDRPVDRMHEDPDGVLGAAGALAGPSAL
jgi:hypothetical protein